MPAKRTLNMEEEGAHKPTDMTQETASSSNYITHLLKVATRDRKTISKEQLTNFNATLQKVLLKKFKDHYYPSKPFAGSGYRAIRINNRLDPIIGLAAEMSGIEPTILHSALPSELTIWTDPFHVEVRVGENGGIFTIYDICDKALNKIWEPIENINKNNNKPKNSKAKPIIDPTTLCPISIDNELINYLHR